MINQKITNRLIKLHAKGYELDFCLTKKTHITCLQNHEEFPCCNVTVCVIDQVFDYLSRSFKYLHTVETGCGKKGILLMEGIYCYRIIQSGLTDTSTGGGMLG